MYTTDYYLNLTIKIITIQDEMLKTGLIMNNSCSKISRMLQKNVEIILLRLKSNFSGGIFLQNIKSLFK